MLLCPPHLANTLTAFALDLYSMKYWTNSNLIATCKVMKKAMKMNVPELQMSLGEGVYLDILTVPLRRNTLFPVT